MITQRSDADVSRFAKRIPSLAAVAALALILTGLTQAQLKPAQLDSTAVRPSPTAYAEIPAGAQSVVSATLGKADEAYRAKSSGQGYVTENPANHLAAQYAADGVKIRFQNANLDLEFQGWGYGKTGVKQDLADVAPFVDANRVEYRRGALTEWYVNGPLGIEQGFTISQAPPVAVASPDSQHDTLDIALRLRGNLSASIEPGRHALTLRDQRGVDTLHYGSLLAYDASGRELESWIEEQGDSLQLRVNTAGARYPIIVDPWVQAAQLTNSSGLAGDQLARSVAVSGNTVVVGAPFVNAYKGAAYVFVAPTVGDVPTWSNLTTYNAELINNLGAAGDYFGSSVGISGNTVVVGAPDATGPAGADQGAAYVFVEPASGVWATPLGNPTYNALLTASTGDAGDHFGSSVAISGGTIVVGADQANAYQGAAYVFVEPTTAGSAPAWITTSDYNAELTAMPLTYSGAPTEYYLGYSVGINESANTIVAGAPSSDTGLQGAAYVFVAPSGVWATPQTNPTYNAELTDGYVPTGGDQFGYSVGISGNTVVVSAPFATVFSPITDANNVEQGAAYVFVEPGTGWASTSVYNAELTASNGSTDNFLGTAVGISGNTVVAGASGAGAAYVFVAPTVGDVPTWTSENETTELSASGGTYADLLGYTVGISGNTVVAGAPGVTVGTHTYQGAAYVFTGASGPYAQYSLTQMNFGNVAENVPATQTVTVTNTGGEPLTIQLVIPAAYGTILTVTQYTCNGVVSSPPAYPLTISPADSCTFTLQFDPAAPGTIITTLSFEDNAGVVESNLFSTESGPNFLQSVPVSGTGVASLAITTTGALPTGYLNTPYPNTTVAASGGSGIYAWAATGLPPGLSINIASGVISGTPTSDTGSPYSVTVTVTDTSANTATAKFSLIVAASNLTITGPSSLPTGYLNTPYPNTTVAASGGSGIYAWAATGLPPGLSINIASGVISGTPTSDTGSPYSVTVTVTDTSANTATAKFSLIVAASNLTITGPSSLPTGYLNTPYPNTTVAASGGSGIYAWAATGLPPGLSINIASGVISGTPTSDTGSPYSVTVTVTDTSANTATAKFSLIVAASNLTITGPSSLPTGYLNTPYPNTTVAASGGSGIYAWAATGLPPGLSINIASGVISGTPTSDTGSPYSVTVTVTDTSANTATAKFSLIVAASNLTGATTTTINSTASSYMGYALPSGFALVGNPITVNYTVLPVSGNVNATGTVIVEDGFEEFCTPPGTLTSNNGTGSCPLTINALGTGSTPLSAQYTPDAASSSNGLLGSATIAPLFTETVVEIINCGSLAAPQSVPPGTPITFTTPICLASGLVGIDAVQAVVSGGCPTTYTCSANVSAVQGQSGVYTAVVTITPNGAGGIVSLYNHPPLTGLPSQMLFGFGLLLAALLALQFAQRSRARPRFACAAGLVIVLAVLLGGVNSCGSGKAESPAPTYTINVSVSAGTYNVTVPFTLTVTN